MRPQNISVLYKGKTTEWLIDKLGEETGAVLSLIDDIEIYRESNFSHKNGTRLESLKKKLLIKNQTCKQIDFMIAFKIQQKWQDTTPLKEPDLQ